MEINAEMKCINDQYYITFDGCNDIWGASDEFVEMLKQDGII